MRVFEETTEWTDATPNHVYVFDDDLRHIIAYVPQGEQRVRKFKAPIVLDRRGRQFRELEDSAPGQKTNEWRVPGSRGDFHTVRLSEGNYSCSCPGYTYRGACRHVAERQQVDKDLN